MAETTREDAVEFAMAMMPDVRDWQEIQHAMADDDRIAAWVEAEAGGDLHAIIGVCQSVISEAEERMGNALPPSYG